MGVHALMEKQIKLKTSSGVAIHGIVNSTKKTDKLIIFVHGLTGHMNEHHYINAPAYFNPHGYDTFRFNLYSNSNKRQLSEVSVREHIEDLNVVINHFKSIYKSIVIVSHSIGCYVVIKTQLKGINKFIFWDPSKGLTDFNKKGLVYDEKLDKYIWQVGHTFLLSKEMIEDWKDASQIEEYVDQIPPNSAFIFAGDYNIYPAWKPFMKNYPIAVIKGATHVFYEEGVLEELYRATLKLLS